MVVLHEGKHSQFEAAFRTALGSVVTAAWTILLIGSLFAFPILWIWNYVMPVVFGLPELTFWQAFWGSIMVRLVLGRGK